MFDMRQYIYKVLIAAVATLVIFQFTVGKHLDRINDKFDILFSEQGRKQMIISIKKEMKKAIEKENYLNEEERDLIRNFIDKIKSELDS